MKYNSSYTKISLPFFIVIFLINTCIGQTQGNLKVIKKYYDVQRTRLQEIYTVNSIGQRHGFYNFYNIFSVTTSPEFIVEYKNDMLDGQKTTYFTFAHTSLSGIIKEICEYKADKKNGKEIFYDYVYNGKFLSKGMDEDKEIEHIQNGKRLIKSELIYSNDIIVSKKSYHTNGKISENQQADNEGNLLLKSLTNESGVVTYEEKYDDKGYLLKMFELFPNGKLKELKEKNATGLYNYKEYYESGTLKIEQVSDNADKILSETNYSQNGKIITKSVGSQKEVFYEEGNPKEITTQNSDGDIRKEEFFKSGSVQKIIITNAKGNVVQKVVYKSPLKLDFDYLSKNDSTFFNEYDEENKVKLSEIEDKNKNGLKITRTANGGYLQSFYKKNDRGTVILNNKELDSAGKLVSEESYKYQDAYSGTGTKDIIKKVYSNMGGYIELAIQEVFNMLGESNKRLISSKEVDSSGAYLLLKYDGNRVVNAKSVFDSRGKMVSDSTSTYNIQYDSLGNKVFEIKKYTDKWNQTWYDEYTYASDGYIRNRQFYKSATYYNSAGSSVAQEKYPQERILKFSKLLNKNINVGVVIFDDNGNKKQLIIFDQAGNQIKTIKLKSSDEKEYFNLFPVVN